MVNKLAEKYGFETTKEYIDDLKKTGKIGAPSYQKWVEAGRKGTFNYGDWGE